jgi:hypothetical protein
MTARTAELGIGWEQLARRAGIQYETLRALRVGKSAGRPLTRRAVSLALEWTPDSVDRVLSGGDPVASPAAKAPPRPAPLPEAARAGEPPVSEAFFTDHVLPAQNEYDRQVLEAVMRLCDGEGRLLPWESRWPYVSVVLELRHGRRNGSETGLTPPAAESELLLNPRLSKHTANPPETLRSPWDCR